jgi:D-threo-aldose 1-dehydrogenase
MVAGEGVSREANGMETLAIDQTDRRTTRLGFGCSSVMGSLGQRKSLRMLEGAFDAGIRHFDVAPMYGYRQAEACLGEFLQRHPQDTSVTTKYGIAAPKKSALAGLARGLVRPVLSSLPGMKKRLAQTAARVAGRSPRTPFTAAGAQASLERSLTALRRDHIDFWLLHEVQASDIDGAESDGLLRTLEDAVASGKVGRFGVASGREKIPALATAHPAFCRTQQYEWSVLDPLPERSVAFRIHHRALSGRFVAIHQELAARPKTADRWSSEIGIDISRRQNLAQLMLKAALVGNPQSIILFSSKSPQHVAGNARLADDSTLDAAARAFYRLVQTEGASLLAMGPAPAVRASASVAEGRGV